MAKLSQRQILAQITPSAITQAEAPPKVEGYFAQVSGGEITASVEKIYVGGEKFPEVLSAPAEIGDITLTKHFDTTYVSNGAFLPKLRHLVGRAYYDITVYVTNDELKEAGSDRVYPGCLLVGVSEPDGDSSSGAPAVFALTFSVPSIAAPK